jgi:hypothetical protein
MVYNCTKCFKEPSNWAQVVNQFPLVQIVRENPGSIPSGNNFWLDFAAIFLITGVPFP